MERVRFVGFLIQPGLEIDVDGDKRAAQPFSLLDAAPAEKVEHLFGYGFEEGAIGMVQEVENDLPFAGSFPRSFPGGIPQLLLQDEVADPVRDRLEKPFLLLEKRVSVGHRRPLRIEDAYLAFLGILNGNLSGHHPGGFGETGDRIALRSDRYPCAAKMRKLPSRWNRFDDASEDPFARRVRVDKELLDIVETLELLLAFVEETNEIVRLVPVVTHE